MATSVVVVSAPLPAAAQIPTIISSTSNQHQIHQMHQHQFQLDQQHQHHQPQQQLHPQHHQLQFKQHHPHYQSYNQQQQNQKLKQQHPNQHHTNKMLISSYLKTQVDRNSDQSQTAVVKTEDVGVGHVASVETASRKHVELSLELKRRLIHEHEHGVPFTLLGRKYHIATSTAANIWRKKDFFLRSQMSGSRKRCNDRSKYKTVNQVTALFVKAMLERGHKIDGEVIKRFARTAALHCNFKDFHGSNGWLDSFKKRENVCWVRRRQANNSHLITNNDQSSYCAPVNASISAGNDINTVAANDIVPTRSASPDLCAAAAAAAVAAATNQTASHHHAHHVHANNSNNISASANSSNNSSTSSISNNTDLLIQGQSSPTHRCRTSNGELAPQGAICDAMCPESCGLVAAVAAAAALNPIDAPYDRDREIEDWFTSIPFLCKFLEDYHHIEHNHHHDIQSKPTNASNIRQQTATNYTTAPLVQQHVQSQQVFVSDQQQQQFVQSHSDDNLINFDCQQQRYFAPRHVSMYVSQAGEQQTTNNISATNEYDQATRAQTFATNVSAGSSSSSLASSIGAGGCCRSHLEQISPNDQHVCCINRLVLTSNNNNNQQQQLLTATTNQLQIQDLYQSQHICSNDELLVSTGTSCFDQSTNYQVDNQAECYADPRLAIFQTHQASSHELATCLNQQQFSVAETGSGVDNLDSDTGSGAGHWSTRRQQCQASLNNDDLESLGSQSSSGAGVGGVDEMQDTCTMLANRQASNDQNQLYEPGGPDNNNTDNEPHLSSGDWCTSGAHLYEQQQQQLHPQAHYHFNEGTGGCCCSTTSTSSSHHRPINSTISAQVHKSNNSESLAMLGINSEAYYEAAISTASQLSSQNSNTNTTKNANSNSNTDQDQNQNQDPDHNQNQDPNQDLDQNQTQNNHEMWFFAQ